MDRKIFTILSTCAILLSLFPINSSGQSCPTAPYVEEGVCPYEFGCDFIKWVSLARKPLFKNDSDTNSIAYWMEPGDSLTFNYGNMHIDQVGIAININPREGYSVGDTLYLLSYTGEGNFDIWHKGKIENVQDFWYWDPTPKDTINTARLIVPQRMTWWVLLTNEKGQKGWLPLINECPKNGACFGENIVNMIPVNTHGF
jgi:hypothetical protein